MMTLKRQLETALPIEVDGILPDRLAGLSELEISKVPIWLGNEQVPLGEVFGVRVESGNSLTLRWTGHLTNVHWIGAGLTLGCVEIESSTGRHVGSQMQSGIIIVHGSVGDFAGAEMCGGLLRIHGDAGNHLGGCYPGSKWGMNRGEVLVDGNAGQGVGEYMRRGFVAVTGNVDRLCGWNMLAGSIVIGGRCESDCGSGMIRGTLVQLGNHQAPLAPTFIRGGNYCGGTIGLLATRLSDLDFNHFPGLTSRTFAMYHGDQLQGGRGEVFVALGG